MCFFKKRKQKKEAERLAREQAEKEKLEKEQAAVTESEEKIENLENLGADEAKKERKAVYRVVFDKDDSVWKIKKDGAKRTIASYKTKKEALDKVQALSKNQEINFVVNKKDGKFQKKSNLRLNSEKKED